MHTDIPTTYYLQQLSSHLLDPDNIDPNHLAQYIITYNNNPGANDYITSLVQRFFYHNLKHPELVRYIHLIDRLINHSFPLPPTFPTMYAHCFLLALQNNRRKTQQQLKILRKLWTPLLNSQIIYKLRTEVYQLTGIDIDRDIKQQSKKFLITYFQNNMGLSKKKINQILGQSHQIKKYNFLLEPYPKHIPYSINDQQLKKQKKYKLSQQTEPQHKIPSKCEQILLVLSNLRTINQYCCKQCGKYFQLETTLEIHREEHFRQKQDKYRRKQSQYVRQRKMIHIKTRQKRQNSIQQWLSTDSDFYNAFVNSHVIIPHNQLSNIRRNCGFCACGLEVEIVGDCFVYVDAIRMRVEEIGGEKERKGGLDVVHSQCYKVMRGEESEGEAVQ